MNHDDTSYETLNVTPVAADGADTQRDDLAVASVEHDGTITLMVCKAFTGEIVRARVLLSDTIEQAIPEIADQIEYFSPDWEKIGLYNLTRDYEYDLQDRFADTWTEEGDLVIMADGAGCHKE